MRRGWRKQRAREILADVAQTLRWWLLGRLISIAVVGVVTGIGLWALGIGDAAHRGDRGTGRDALRRRCSGAACHGRGRQVAGYTEVFVTSKGGTGMSSASPTARNSSASSISTEPS